MRENDEILTIPEVAAELRCSKAHVYNIIRGKVAGVQRLPVISLGRRKLVRRGTFEKWKAEHERGSIGVMMPASPEVDAVGRVKGEFHA